MNTWQRIGLRSKVAITKLLFLAFSLCVCTRYQHNAQITAVSSNLAFYICIIGRCYLNLFLKVGQNSVYRGTQKNSNTLRPMDGI